MANMSYLVKLFEANPWVRNFKLSPSATTHRPPSAVRQIENYPTTSQDAPTSPITIASAGVLSPDDPCLTVTAEPADGDAYEDFPDDEDQNIQDPEVALKIAREIREIANKLFKEGNAEAALAKYQSQNFYYCSFTISEAPRHLL
jgi:peptidyl-prolyl isomerase D